MGGVLELLERDFFLSWSDIGNWIVCFQLYHQPYFTIPELCLPPLLCCTHTPPKCSTGTLLLLGYLLKFLKSLQRNTCHVATCSNLFSKITKQFIDQHHQTLYHTQKSADKERQRYLSLPVPAGAVPTIPTQRHCKQWARAGTRPPWTSRCQTDYG